MKRILILFFLIFWSITSIAQTRIKAMTYNLMHFPSTMVYSDAQGDYINRTSVLKGILDSYQPDIFMVCELESSEGADMILRDALQTEDLRYNRANFAYNQSSTDASLQQMVFYNEQKMMLIDQNIIITDIRDINHYTFKLNSTENIIFDVFVTHLKSSDGSANEYTRYRMVEQFTNYLNNLPPDRYVIFTGDFNLYKSTELGYVELLDPTNNIALVDPINRPGTWTNNVTFTDIHTQSPLTTNYHFRSTSGSRDGATSGLDDRFDFILVSQNMINSSQFKYVPGTYKAYGNNGNCYNTYISNTACVGEFSQDLRNLLVNMSDHLPVVMEFETPETLGINDEISQKNIWFSSNNVVYNNLEIGISDPMLGSEIELYNQLGQQMDIILLKDHQVSIDVSNYERGVYFIRYGNSQSGKPLKFIKF